jgi:PhnB protein
MARMVPYLGFHGNCHEAMKFYQQCLGGELQVQTIGESPMAADMPAEAHSNVLHSMLRAGNFILMASDGMGGPAPTHGNAVALCMVGDSKEEIEQAFAKLSEGANVTHPLKEEFFGTFGDLTDKYGFNWMFQFGGGEPL